MSANLADATKKVVEILEAFESEDRTRVVRAALLLLGDASDSVRVPANSLAPINDFKAEDEWDFINQGARAWAKRASVDRELLEHFFHFDQGKVIPIALPVPAKSKKDQTVAVYLITGLAALMERGDSSFTDEDARAFCQKFGCYDRPNHSTIVKSFGNRFTGSKSTGWKLTAPGLTEAVALMKSANQ